jgi:hypothetical protein
MAKLTTKSLANYTNLYRHQRQEYNASRRFDNVQLRLSRICGHDGKSPRFKPYETDD